MRFKNHSFLNAALIGSLLYPAITLAELSGPGFCLKTCTAEFCGASQENYQHCQNACRGKYDGLIKSCKKAAQDAGFTDEQVNNKAQFHPCPCLAKKEAASHKENAPSADERNEENETQEGDSPATHDGRATTTPDADAEEGNSSENPDASARTDEETTDSEEDGEPEEGAEPEFEEEEGDDPLFDEADKAAEGAEA